MLATRRHAVQTAALLAVAVMLGPARAAFADARDLSVGDVYICTITHDASGYSSYDRATQIRQRITQVLSTPRFRHGATVYVRREGAATTISVEDVLVFTVAPEDIAGTNETTLALAKTWAQRLTKGLTVAMPGSEFHFHF